jgi:hypothetical protein
MYLNKATLVVLDKFGFLPLTHIEATFFRFVSGMFEKTSLVLTSNNGLYQQMMGDLIKVQ